MTALSFLPMSPHLQSCVTIISGLSAWNGLLLSFLSSYRPFPCSCPSKLHNSMLDWVHPVLKCIGGLCVTEHGAPNQSQVWSGPGRPLQKQLASLSCVSCIPATLVSSNGPVPFPPCIGSRHTPLCAPSIVALLLSGGDLDGHLSPSGP